MQAEAPSRPIERGLREPGLLAHVLVGKFADNRRCTVRAQPMGALSAKWTMAASRSTTRRQCGPFGAWRWGDVMMCSPGGGRFRRCARRFHGHLDRYGQTQYRGAGGLSAVLTHIAEHPSTGSTRCCCRTRQRCGPLSPLLNGLIQPSRAVFSRCLLDDWETIRLWCRSQLARLRGILPYANGIPSPDTPFGACSRP